MDELYSLTDLAETISDSIGGDKEQKALINRQLRNIVSQRLIEATATRSGRRTVMLDVREAAKARIQIAIIDAGLDAVTLRSVSDFWDRAIAWSPSGIPLALNEHYPPRGLDAVIFDAARSDAPDWSFVIKVRRVIETGERIIVAEFHRDDQPPPSEDSPMSDEGLYADGVAVKEGRFDDKSGEVHWSKRLPTMTVATISIPATKLIRPLLNVT